MMVCGTSSIVIVRPRTPGSRPNRRAQYASPRTTTRFGVEPRSSRGSIKIPMAGRIPRTSEVIAGDLLADDRIGLAIDHHPHRRCRVHLEGPRDGLRVALQMFIEGVGGAFRHAAVSPVKYLEEPGRILNRQRTQHQRIEDAEDRRGRADAERERQHGGGGERRTPAEAAKSVAKILSEPFPPDPHGQSPARLP